MRFVEFRARDTEPFANGTRRRVTRVAARMRTTGAGATTTRDDSVMPLALYEGDVADERPMHCDRGHVIALEFGAPEARDNLVPMYGRFNSGGVWRRMEITELPAYANTKHAEGVTHMEVEVMCRYSTDAAADPRIPVAFIVTAKAAGAAAAEITWTIPHELPAPTAAEVDATHYDVITAARTRMNLEGWLIENHLGSPSDLAIYRTKPVFAGVANPHASHAERPYGFLDYMEWEAVQNTPRALEVWRNRVVLSATSQFSTPQIAAIIKANRTLNRGFLRSDCLQDLAYTTLKYRVIGHPAGTLVEESRDLGPQVDHIIPLSRTGCAVYSNAQVLSGAYNNRKRAAITAEQHRLLLAPRRGTGRRRAMTVTQKELANVIAAHLKKIVSRDRHSLLDDCLITNSADVEVVVFQIANSRTASTLRMHALALKRKWGL